MTSEDWILLNSSNVKHYKDGDKIDPPISIFNSTSLFVWTLLFCTDFYHRYLISRGECLVQKENSTLPCYTSIGEVEYLRRQPYGTLDVTVQAISDLSQNNK